MDRAALPPTWLEELLELLQARRRLAVAVAVAVAVLGVILAAVAPGILPPTVGVGVAVGIAACLLAVAAVVGIDAGDLKVRGARHVRAAGAEVSAVLRGEGAAAGGAAVVARLDVLGAARVAIVPADAAARDEAVAVVEALGEAWARAGRRVLVMDLTRADDGHAGIVDVVRGTMPLGEAVTFDPELMLARLGAGADLETALVELPGLAPRLPADIERTIVALPPLVDPAARAGATALAEVLVLARVDRTSRVDLLATLEALDVGGVVATVLLHRPLDTPSVATGATAMPEPDGGADDEGDPDPTGPIRSFATTEPEERGPRPVPAARERSDGGGADAPTDAPQSDAPSDAAADSTAPSEVLDEGPTATLLGLDAIERDVEAEARTHVESVRGSVDRTEDAAPRAYEESYENPSEDRYEAQYEAVGARRGALRAVAHEPVVLSAAPIAEPPRTLRAVDDLDDLPRARRPEHPLAPVAGDADEDDDLTTTAVLETLAQEIWSRENIGGTA